MESFVFFVILGLSSLSLGNAEDTLEKLQVIFRHGYRYPLIRAWSENDACAKSYDDLKMGNLTNLGKSQMSLLGYFLRVHYNSFIGDDPNKVKAYYSDCYRDFESATLVNAALFQNFNLTLPQLDVLNKTTEGEVATNDTAYDSWLENLSWNNQLRDQCKKLDGTNGLSCKNRTEFQDIVDQMISEQAEGCTLPSWLTPEVTGNLQAEYKAVYESLELCTSKDFIQDNSDKMLKLMNEVFNQENKTVQLYASHDTNIAIILTRMGVFNSLPVPIGAALVFEQHTIDKKRIIRVFYDNSTDYSNFQKLKLPGCGWDCPQEKFVEIVTGQYPCNFATRLETLGVVTMAIMSTMLFWLLH